MLLGFLFIVQSPRTCLTQDIYKQISCFDPNRFHEGSVTAEKMNYRIIAEAISDTDTTALQEEIVSFANS